MTTKEKKMLAIVTDKQKHVIEYLGAKFICEPNTTQEDMDIVKNNTFVHKTETDRGAKDQYEDRIDWVGVQIDRMVSQVVGWEGIADGLECNDANKTALASRKENTHICIHIQQEMAKIGEAEEVKKDKKRKN